MMFSLRILAGALLFPAALFSQIAWQTTHNGTSSGECQLVANKIRLTVYPFHVDVEEEAIIAAIGSVWWGDSSTLEIFGEFTLSKGAALRSMLLWNGKTILKAKLKDRTEADSAYENVVDRDKPQPIVRDPSLIEYLGNDRYRIKIYPVVINNSRKIRILYSVPFQTTGGGPKFQILPAFVMACPYYPTQVPIEILKVSSLSTNYLMAYGSTLKTIQFGATYQVPMTDLIVDHYTDWGWLEYQSVGPIYISPDTSLKICSFSARIDSGKTAGNYTAVFAAVPDTIKALMNEVSSIETFTIDAKVVTGENAYITDFNQKVFFAAYIKSGAPWDSAIHWTLYNSKGKIAMEYAQRTDPVSDSLTQSMLPLIWGAKYSLVEGNDNLGSLFGFVDRKMSLLALESDSLPAAEAARWAQAGVPPLNPDEIILKPSHMPTAPDDNVIFELSTAVRIAHADALSTLTVMVLPNRMFRISFGKAVTGSIHIVLYDISGRVIATWDNLRPVSNRLELALPPQARGCMVLRVQAGKEMVRKKLIVAK